MSIENSCVRLDEGRWNPKNREVLENLIKLLEKMFLQVILKKDLKI